MGLLPLEDVNLNNIRRGFVAIVSEKIQNDIEVYRKLVEQMVKDGKVSEEDLKELFLDLDSVVDQIKHRNDEQGVGSDIIKPKKSVWKMINGEIRNYYGKELLRKMKIYIVCPVRNVTEEQKKELDTYVEQLEKEGHHVYYPPRDVNQNDETGWNICQAHKKAMIDADRVDVFWDKTSTGSHFDIGMAFMENKKVKLVKTYQEDNPGKSYIKVMKQMK